MSIVFFEANGERKSSNLQRIARAAGFEYRSYDSFLAHGFKGVSYAVVQGILGPSGHIIKQAQKTHTNFIYLDYGYFKESKRKDRWYRVHINSFHAQKWYDYTKTIKPRPWRKFDRLSVPQIAPWKQSGDYILICPPTPAVTEYFSQHNWLNKTLEDLKKYTDRPIVIRHKPRAVNVHWEKNLLLNSGTNTGTIEEDSLINQINGAWAMITYNSVTAVDAIRLGVPVFSGPECATHLLGNTDLSKIESPSYMSQAPLLWSLAEFQYSRTELYSAQTWDNIIKQAG